MTEITTIDELADQIVTQVSKLFKDTIYNSNLEPFATDLSALVLKKLQKSHPYLLSEAEQEAEKQSIKQKVYEARIRRNDQNYITQLERNMTKEVIEITRNSDFFCEEFKNMIKDLENLCKNEQYHTAEYKCIIQELSAVAVSHLTNENYHSCCGLLYSQKQLDDRELDCFIKGMRIWKKSVQLEYMYYWLMTYG